MKIAPETISRIKQVVGAEAVLQHLGFHLVRRTSKELRGPCKVHGGDNPTAFRFNLDNKTWKCFTRHCEGDNDRDLVGLVQKTTNQSFVDSVKFLADLAGIDLNNQEKLTEEFFRLREAQEQQREIARSRAHSFNPSFLPEEMLEGLLGSRFGYFAERGFAEELLDFYEVGGWVDTKGVQRETIPVRDDDGNLITISARRIDSDEDPTYILLKDSLKGNALYNLYIAKSYTRMFGDDRELVIVEGFTDVWRLVSLGVYNVVALMGTGMTPNQNRLIFKYAENAILLLDADTAGKTATPRGQKMLNWNYEKLNSLGVAVKIVDLPEGKDPKLFTNDDVETYLGYKRR